MKFIASILLAICALASYAQEGPPKRQKDFVPSALYLSADGLGLAKTIVSNRTELDFQAKVDLDFYFLAVDYGFSKFDLSNTNFSYTNEGSFFRIGPQVNLMPYNKHRSMITFGLSYAFAQFKDQTNFFVSGQNWNDAQINLSNDNLKSSWYEMSLGLMVKLAGPIHIGYMARYQFAQSVSGYGDLFPYEVPGFGSAGKGNNFRFNYYITYKLGFRNKPIPKRPRRIVPQPQPVENPTPTN